MRIVGLFAVFTVAVLIGSCAHRSDKRMATKSQTTFVPIVSQPIVIIETNQVVFVGGEVKEPGRCLWSEGLTLSRAIQMAGGFTDFANQSQVELRRMDGSWEIFRHGAILKGMTSDPLLRPNDQVRVRKKGLPFPPEVWPVLRTLVWTPI